MTDIVDRWFRRLESSDSHRTYWVSFLVVFAIAFVLAFGVLWISGRSFIWLFDGFEQQYPYFVMEGDWLRELASNIVSGTFAVPMWNPLVGYGADYVISASNTLGNPINLLSVFATPQNAEFLLALTIPITLLLAGVTFSRFCFYKGWDGFSTLVGSVAYLFGGYTVIALTQIYMLYPLVLAPICLLGVEKVFDGGSPAEFIVGVGLCCLSSVSLGFNACLLLLAYCVVRYFFLPEHHCPSSFLRWFLRIFCLVVLGVMVAAVLFLPTAIAILGQGRIGLERPDQLLYPLGYYARLLAALFFPQPVGADCVLGVGAVVVAAMALLLCKDRREPQDKLAVIIAVVFGVFLVFPAFGKLFNGFAYPNNRWVWAVSLLSGIVCVLGVRTASRLDARARRRAALMVAVLVLVTLMLFPGRSHGGVDPSTLFWALVLTALAVAALLFMAKCPRASKLAILAIALVSSCHGLANWSQWRASSNIPVGSAYPYMVEGTPVSLVLTQPDAATSTYDFAGLPAWRNSSLVSHVPGLTFYNSMYNGYIDEFHTSVALNSAYFNFQYCGMDSRTPLSLLAGTRYYALPVGREALLPAQFDKHVLDGAVAGTPASLYSTDLVLPVAYSTDCVMSRGDYDQLTPVQRQEALLHGVVLEHAPAGSSPAVPMSSQADLSLSETPSHAVAEGFEATQHGIAAVDGNTVTVTAPGQCVYVNYSGAVPGERYLSVDDLALVPADGASAESFSVDVACGDVRRSVMQYMSTYHIYGGKDDWVFDLGRDSATEGTVAIRFSVPGTYTLGGVRVEVEDVEAVLNSARTLASHRASDIDYSGNHLACRVGGAADGDYLVARVPFGDGWSATVNGRDVEPLQANVGFTAVPLQEGDNEVVLSYATPGLAVGALVSAVGVVCSVLVVHRWHREHDAS